MTTAATSLLGLALPVTSELAGTWGDVVNNSLTSLLDTAVAGTTTLSTDADVTLTTTTLVANQARQAIILWTANGTTTRNITAPAQSKIYTVINASAGTQSIVLRGAGPTTGVTIIKGESAVCAWNGSDFIKISNTGGSASFTNVTVSGTTTLSGLTASTALALDASKNVVSVTNTGTGNNVLSASPTLTGTVAGASLSLSSLTSGRVTYAGTSGLLQDSASLTFDGTTLTAGGLATGGSVTLSGGTANGVLYLNGSKVATSGSALTFDGATMALGQYLGANGRLNITTASSGTFQIATYMTNAVDTDFQIRFKTGISDIGTSTSTPLTFSYAGSEQMRLTSTGLGIGTTSNIGGAKLDVRGANSNNLADLDAQVLTLFDTTAYASGVGAGIAFGYKFNSGGSFIQRGAVIKAAKENGTDGNYATALVFGTTGNAVATSEKMRLDSSGNLGLGVTPSAWRTDFNQRALQLNNASFSTFNDDSLYIVQNGYLSSTGWKYTSTNAASQYIQSVGAHAWFNAPSGTAGNAISFTQAMTLNASGGLSVGTTTDPGAGNIQLPAGGQLRYSSTAYITPEDNVAGARISAPGIIGFWTGSTPAERARIDSSGNLMAGRTSALAGARISAETSTGSPTFASYGPTTGTEYAFDFVNPNGIVGSITTNGSATAFNTSSDYRLKDNPQPLNGSGAFIDALKPKTWNWKADGSVGVGFIAHEVQEVSPNSVVGEKDGEQMQAMEYGSAEFIANIIAELQSLRARVAALES